MRPRATSPANVMVVVVTVIWVVTAILSEQAMASSAPDMIDDDCYYNCYISCLGYQNVADPMFCVEDCQVACKINNVHDAYYYCNIGCWFNMCHRVGHGNPLSLSLNIIRSSIN